MKVVLDYIGTIRTIWPGHQSTNAATRHRDPGMSWAHKWAADLKFIPDVGVTRDDLCGDKLALERIQAHHRFVFVFRTSFEHFSLAHFSTTPSQTTK